MNVFRKLILLMPLLLTVPAFAQSTSAGQATGVKSAAEPLPDCTPGSSVAASPVLFDTTSAELVVCWPTNNTWTPVGQTLTPLSASTVGLKINASAAQTADLMDFSVGGTKVAYVDRYGNAYFKTLNTTQSGPILLIGNEASKSITPQTGVDILYCGDPVYHSCWTSLNGAAAMAVPEWSTDTPSVGTLLKTGSQFPQLAPSGLSESGGVFSIGSDVIDGSEQSAPANPGSGLDRIYFDSSTHQLKCVTSSGANCLASSSGFDLTTANTLTNVAEPGTPASGETAIWSDSTNKVFSAKSDAGTVTHTVESADCGSDFVQKINADGTVSCAAATSGSGGVSSSTITSPAIDGVHSCGGGTTSAECSMYVWPSTHTLVRVVVYFVIAPAGCSTYGHVGVMDRTSSTTLWSYTLTGSESNHQVVDSGAISVSIPSGDTIAIGAIDSTSGCSTGPLIVVTGIYQ